MCILIPCRRPWAAPASAQRPAVVQLECVEPLYRIDDTVMFRYKRHLHLFLSPHAKRAAVSNWDLKEGVNILKEHQAKTEEKSAAAPRYITNLITNCVSLADIRAVVMEYGHSMEPISVTAAVVKIPKVMHKKDGTEAADAAARVLERLKPHVLRVLPQLTTREVSSMFWALSKVQAGLKGAGVNPDVEGGADQQLVDVLIDKLLDNNGAMIREAAAQGLGMVVTAAQELAPFDDSLWDALEATTLARAQDKQLEPLLVMNLAWGFAKAWEKTRPARRPTAVMQALAEWVAVPDNAARFNAQSVGSLLWAFSTTGGRGQRGKGGNTWEQDRMGQTLQALGDVVLRCIPDFDANSLAMVVQSFGRCRYYHPAMMDAIANQLDKLLPRQSPDTPKKPKMAWNKGQITPLTLVMTAFAAAQTGAKQPAFIKYAAAQLSADTGSFTVGQIALTLRAAHIMEWGDVTFWEGVAQHITPSLHEYDPWALVAVASAYAAQINRAAGSGYQPLFEAVAATAKSRSTGFSPSEVTRLLQALAVANCQGSQEAAEALIDGLITRLKDPNDKGVHAVNVNRNLRQMLIALHDLGLHADTLKEKLEATAGETTPAAGSSMVADVSRDVGSSNFQDSSSSSPAVAAGLTAEASGESSSDEGMDLDHADISSCSSGQTAKQVNTAAATQAAAEPAGGSSMGGSSSQDHDESLGHSVPSSFRREQQQQQQQQHGVVDDVGSSMPMSSGTQQQPITTGAALKIASGLA
eukprot:jgi/Chrzof1/12369/Cz06g31330.t1